MAAWAGEHHQPPTSRPETSLPQLDTHKQTSASILSRPVPRFALPFSVKEQAKSIIIIGLDS